MVPGPHRASSPHEGGERRFDFVVGADGPHSAVRRLAFGEESRFVRHLGMYVGIVDVDPRFARTDWGVMHNSPGKLAGVYSFHGKAAADDFYFDSVSQVRMTPWSRNQLAKVFPLVSAARRVLKPAESVRG